MRPLLAVGVDGLGGGRQTARAAVGLQRSRVRELAASLLCVAAAREEDMWRGRIGVPSETTSFDTRTLHEPGPALQETELWDVPIPAFPLWLGAGLFEGPLRFTAIHC